jgi:hypothetical protein
MPRRMNMCSRVVTPKIVGAGGRRETSPLTATGRRLTSMYVCETVFVYGEAHLRVAAMDNGSSLSLFVCARARVHVCVCVCVCVCI